MQTNIGRCVRVIGIDKPFFQKEIFGFAKEILYLMHNEKQKGLQKNAVWITRDLDSQMKIQLH